MAYTPSSSEGAFLLLRVRTSLSVTVLELSCVVGTRIPHSVSCLHWPLFPTPPPLTPPSWALVTCIILICSQAGWSVPALSDQLKDSPELCPSMSFFLTGGFSPSSATWASAHPQESFGTLLAPTLCR